MKSLNHLQLRRRLVLRIRRQFPTSVFKCNDNEKPKKNMRKGSWKMTGGTAKWDRLGQVGVRGIGETGTGGSLDEVGQDGTGTGGSSS